MNRLRLATALLLPLVILASSAWADPGNITGKVLDSRTKDALPFSNVVIVGTPYGAMSMEDGSYFIRNVPEGTYTVKASYMGYESQEQAEIAVLPFSTTDVDFKLLKTVLTSRINDGYKTNNAAITTGPTPREKGKGDALTDHFVYIATNVLDAENAVGEQDAVNRLPIGEIFYYLTARKLLVLIKEMW